MEERRIIQVSISVVSGLFIIGHIVWPEVKIDGVTVFLLIVAITPWLAPVFKSVELPGGFKVEYHEKLEKAKKKLEDSGLISTRELHRKIPPHSKYSFMNVVDIDSNLALSGLRMEIESRLKDLAVNSGISVERSGIHQITRRLVDSGVLSVKESSAILDLLPILNKAVHGQDVDPLTHKWVIEFGPQILDGLEARLGEQKLPDLISSYRNRDGAQSVEVGYELSKQLIRSTDSFFALMKENNQVYKDWMSEIGASTFTLLEASDEIEEELAFAKYSRLKEIMIQKVQEYLEKNKESQEALELLDRLNKVQLSSIW